MNILLVILAYLLGSIPFGFVIGKMKGIDVRQYGSGNIGTSNVARTMGKTAAILTLLGDGLKALIPVLLAKYLLENEAWIVAVGLAAIVGHNWSLYMKFKGGKGVTTTYGAYLGIAWLPGLATILTWVGIVSTTKKSSIAALVSALCAPVYAYALTDSLPVLVFALIGLVMIYIRHIDNIKRILSGTEIRLDQKIDVEKNDS